jgi:putative acetyltransferase
MLAMRDDSVSSSAMIPSIRSSTIADRPSILALVKGAFTSPGHDGQEEVNIVETTWTLGASPDALEVVAESGGAVVGHVQAAIGELDGHDVLAVAPLCVAPVRHGEGIGTALMNELLRRIEHQGWPLVLVLGDPGYYRRFGFEPAGAFGIVYPPVGPDDPHFQVRRFPSFRTVSSG